MDSSAPHCILNPSTFYPMHYQMKDDNGGNGIDLDLSLSTQQPQPHYCYPYSHLVRYEDYAENEIEEGVQSKERWVYVKVNMEGVIIGRKVCILDHSNYSSLAFQLEDMFGRQYSLSGLRLFQAGSEFTLFYKDRDDSWRAVGDIPWKFGKGGSQAFEIQS
ncbi:auxin-responsive protein IAA34-like [Malania oleifera]|uniref:auxin-responsive protein IAA34-like n=1 Tax=Malania oleifera TaxID=397392 RepID=UPI0025AEB399|nr:auxin-responsive protein IAA34-like [Malania oleifera]